MELFIGQLFAGLSLGSILLLAALGLALTFGQMGVINLAHGEFIMAGAYTASTVQPVISNAGASLLVSIPVAFLVGGLLGLALEELLLRRLYHRPLDTLLVTFGVSLILQQIARDIFGAPSVDVRSPDWLQGNVEILGAPIPFTRLCSSWSLRWRPWAPWPCCCPGQRRAGASGPWSSTATWPKPAESPADGPTA